jgi:hypothetical protein
MNFHRLSRDPIWIRFEVNNIPNQSTRQHYCTGHGHLQSILLESKDQYEREREREGSEGKLTREQLMGVVCQVSCCPVYLINLIRYKIRSKL